MGHTPELHLNEYIAVILKICLFFFGWDIRAIMAFYFISDKPVDMKERKWKLEKAELIVVFGRKNKGFKMLILRNIEL